MKEAGLFVLCCFAFVVRAMSTEKTQKKTLFYSVFVCVVVFTGFWQQKGQNKRGKQDSKKEKTKGGKLTRINWEIGRKSAKKH